MKFVKLVLGGPVLVMDTPTTPVVDRALYHHRWVMVSEDMDGIREGRTGSVKIATGLGNLFGIQRELVAKKNSR